MFVVILLIILKTGNNLNVQGKNRLNYGISILHYYNSSDCKQKKKVLGGFGGKWEYTKNILYFMKKKEKLKHKHSGMNVIRAVSEMGELSYLLHIILKCLCVHTYNEKDS